MADTEEKFALGAGIMLPMGGATAIAADYALESWGPLGMIQKFSLRLKF